MIYDRWNHSQDPPKKPLHLSYTHYNKARLEFVTSSLNKHSIRDKTQRNRINRVRLTSPKVHLSKTIHNWHRPLRIVPYCAIIYASFSKRAPMTVTWSNFVNNTLIASRRSICTLCSQARRLSQQVRQLLRWDLGVIPVIVYHSNAVPCALFMLLLN